MWPRRLQTHGRSTASGTTVRRACRPTRWSRAGSTPGFAGEVRGLVHDPATGLAGCDPEAALTGIAETIPLLGDLKDR